MYLFQFIFQNMPVPHSPQIWTAESPIRTPKAKYSPPTPKTNLLEEKTRDLQLLKVIIFLIFQYFCIEVLIYELFSRLNLRQNDMKRDF